MKKLFLIILAIIHLGCADIQQQSTAHSFSLNTSPTHAQCGLPDSTTRDSIVAITSSGGDNASGVIIGQNRILTVAHAVNELDLLQANINGAIVNAQLLMIDHANDLALLAAPTQQLEAITISNAALTKNEPVWALGFPLAQEQKLSLGLYRNMMNGRLYTTTHINSGSSGGALLHCNAGKFELAGIVHGFVARVEGERYINLGDSTSVPADSIKLFISDAADGRGEQMVSLLAL